jgi:hypothetical protein
MPLWVSALTLYTHSERILFIFVYKYIYHCASYSLRTKKQSLTFSEKAQLPTITRTQRVAEGVIISDLLNTLFARNEQCARTGNSISGINMQSITTECRSSARQRT